jgi:hypothetical protein
LRHAPQCTTGFRMTNDQLKIVVLCLLAFVATGSTSLNLNTWLRLQNERQQQTIVALLIYATIAAMVFALIAAAWFN